MIGRLVSWISDLSGNKISDFLLELFLNEFRQLDVVYGHYSVSSLYSQSSTIICSGFLVAMNSAAMASLPFQVMSSVLRSAMMPVSSLSTRGSRQCLPQTLAALEPALNIFLSRMQYYYLQEPESEHVQRSDRHKRAPPRVIVCSLVSFIPAAASWSLPNPICVQGHEPELPRRVYLPQRGPALISPERGW